MFSTRRTAALGFGILCTLTAAGCGSSYDRDEVITEFVDSGLTQEQAVCLVDTLEAEIGTDRLGERGSLTAEEEAIITDATFTCVLGEGE